jgi:hypothetical protein
LLAEGVLARVLDVVLLAVRVPGEAENIAEEGCVEGCAQGYDRGCDQGFQGF